MGKSRINEKESEQREGDRRAEMKERLHVEESGDEARSRGRLCGQKINRSTLCGFTPASCSDWMKAEG